MPYALFVGMLLLSCKGGFGIDNISNGDDFVGITSKPILQQANKVIFEKIKGFIQYFASTLDDDCNNIESKAPAGTNSKDPSRSENDKPGRNTPDITDSSKNAESTQRDRFKQPCSEDPFCTVIHIFYCILGKSLFVVGMMWKIISLHSGFSFLCGMAIGAFIRISYSSRPSTFKRNYNWLKKEDLHRIMTKPGQCQQEYQTERCAKGSQRTKFGKGYVCFSTTNIPSFSAQRGCLPFQSEPKKEAFCPHKETNSESSNLAISVEERITSLEEKPREGSRRESEGNSVASVTKKIETTNQNNGKESVVKNAKDIKDSKKKAYTCESKNVRNESKLMEELKEEMKCNVSELAALKDKTNQMERNIETKFEELIMNINEMTRKMRNSNLDSPLITDYIIMKTIEERLENCEKLIQVQQTKCDVEVSSQLPNFHKIQYEALCNKIFRLQNILAEILHDLRNKTVDVESRLECVVSQINIQMQELLAIKELLTSNRNRPDKNETKNQFGNTERNVISTEKSHSETRFDCGSARNRWREIARQKSSARLQNVVGDNTIIASFDLLQQFSLPFCPHTDQVITKRNYNLSEEQRGRVTCAIASCFPAGNYAILKLCKNREN